MKFTKHEKIEQVEFETIRNKFIKEFKKDIQELDTITNIFNKVNPNIYLELSYSINGHRIIEDYE